MPGLAIRDITQDTLIVCGVPITSGRAGDAFIDFEFPEDYEYEESADGIIVITHTHASLSTCRLTLSGVSPDLKKLSALRIASDPNGATVGPLLYKDNAETLVSSPNSWLSKMPNFSRSRSTPNVVFDIKFRAIKGSTFLGGLTVTGD